MDRDQTGFSIVEILLVLVVVFAVGFGGWYVWHAKHKTDSKASITSSPATKTTPEVYKRTTTVPSDWKTYTNTQYKISLAYPPGWEVGGGDTAGVGEKNQVYSLGETPAGHQYRVFGIDIFKQSLASKVTESENGYKASYGKLPQSQTLTIDGHEAMEVDSFAYSNTPVVPIKEYYIYANGFTYHFFGVFSTNPTSDPPMITAHDTLIIFESLKIQ